MTPRSSRHNKPVFYERRPKSRADCNRQDVWKKGRKGDETTYKEILEDWEEEFFREMIAFHTGTRGILNPYMWPIKRFDDDSIAYFRKGDFHRYVNSIFTDVAKARKVHNEYLRERNRRKKEFQNWLALEMDRGRWRDSDCVQKKTFDLSLPKNTWRRIRELAEQSDKSVDQVVSIIVEATANRFADLE